MKTQIRRRATMLKLTKHQWSIALFNLIYLIAFTIYYISIKNYEFLWYIFVVFFFFILILLTLEKSKFDNIILWGLSIWALLHMCGGGLIVNNDVLYNLKLIHFFNIGTTFVLKFDQFVHMFGFAVTVLVAYHLLKPYLNEKTNWYVVYPLIVLISMGAGALNEIVEFIATVSFSNVNVGGYYNTALDMIFNTIGAIIAIFFIYFKYRKNK